MRGALIVTTVIIAGCAADPSSPPVDLGAVEPGAPPAVRSPGPASAVASAWPEADSCPDLLAKILSQAGQDRLPPDPAKAPLVLVVEDGLMTGAQRSKLAFEFDHDLGLPVYGATEQLPEPAPRCLLLVERPHMVRAEPRRVASQKQITSRYASRTQLVENPKYEAAKIRLKRAEKALDRSSGGWAGVGDPIIDMVSVLVRGAVSAFDEGRREREYEEALAAFSRLEPKIEKPVLTSYQLDLVQLTAAKRTNIRVALVDCHERTAVAATLSIKSRKSFRVSDDIHENDRGAGSHLATMADIETWERGSPDLVQSHLAARLITSAQPTEHKDAFSLLAAWRDQAPAERVIAAPETHASEADSSGLPPSFVRDRRAESVVMIRSTGRVGSGFYVEPHRIITSARLVDRASAVDITLVDGTELLAVVEHVDPVSNLAVIWAQKAGQPLPLYEGDPIKPGTRVDLLCHLPGMGAMVNPGKLGPVADNSSGQSGSPGRSGSQGQSGSPGQSGGVGQSGASGWVKTRTPIASGQIGGPVMVGSKVFAVSDRTADYGRVAVGPTHDQIAKLLEELKGR